jgi:hypothetical protein
MESFNLSALIRENNYDAGLANALKKRDVAEMASRLSAGACPTSASNVLHYNPEFIVDILEASAQLEQQLRDTVQMILGAMCHRLAGRQRDLYRNWIARQAAVSALNEMPT